MARHRNVRAMDPDEEYEGYYSCYGHSVEDEFCISPRTEAQFLYDRNAEKHSMSSFLVSQPEAEAEYNSEDSPTHGHNKSYEKSSNLSDMDKAKMQSCVEAIQDVVGDTVSEVILKRAAIDHSFDVTKALNAVLSGVYSTSQEDTAFRDGKNSNCGKKEKQQDQLNKLRSDVSSLKISTASSSENKDCLLKQCARPRELDFKDGENSSGPAENVNNIEKFDESTSENSYSTNITPKEADGERNVETLSQASEKETDKKISEVHVFESTSSQSYEKIKRYLKEDWKIVKNDQDASTDRVKNLVLDDKVFRPYATNF